MPWGTVAGYFQSAFRAMKFRFYASVHRKLYQKYSLAAGDAYDIREADGHPPLDQYIQYFNAFETYPDRAIFYLRKAREFEIVVIPESAGSYYLEEGTLRKDTSLVARALDALNPVWERDLISTCHREFALRGSASSAEDLFALNRGALLQAGISLPVEIRFNNVDGRKFTRALAKAGFVNTSAARFGLDIAVNTAPINATPPTGAPPSGGFTVFCELRDSEGVIKPLRHAIPLRSMSRADISTFARTLGQLMFRVEG
jgi:hypothetical protein